MFCPENDKVMREASRNGRSRNEVKSTYELTQLLQFSGWNKGTDLHSIHNGDHEIVIYVRYVPPPLIFNTTNEVFCRLIQWYRLSVWCASWCLSRQFRTECPRCIWLQNMPLVQIQTCSPSLVPNFQNCFNAVLSRYTPIIAMCE